MHNLSHKPWFTTLLGVVFGLLILVPSLLYLLRDSLPESSLKRLGERAFGDLSASLAAPENAQDERTTQQTAKPSLYPVIADEFPFPEHQQTFEYVYDGELPDLSQVDPTVYRRADALSLPDSLSQSLTGLTLGFIPLSTFENLNLQGFSIREESKTGYTISFDRQFNAVFLSRNDAYWSMLDTLRPVSAQDIPADEEVTAIADAFLREHRIDTTGFGSAVVDRSTLDLDSWVPDSLSVTYPVVINGMPVWDLWGQPSGLNVTVNLRSEEVESLWGPGPSTLEASTYNLVTDQARILKVARRGGLWEAMPENATVTNVSTLGEPDLILTSFEKEDSQGRFYILYLPALRFPVVEPAADVQRQWVVVPLVQEVLDAVDGGSLR